MKLFTFPLKIPFKMYHCQRCSKTFSRKFTLERHIEKLHEHKIEYKKRKIVKCMNDIDIDSYKLKKQDPLVLSVECVKVLQKFVRNGKLGKVKVTKSTLVDLILNLNCKQESDDEDKDNEINQPLNGLQLQLLQVMLNAVKKGVFHLRKDNFVALINCFVVKKM